VTAPVIVRGPFDQEARDGRSIVVVVRRGDHVDRHRYFPHQRDEADRLVARLLDEGAQRPV
jgi:hypothetical protein